MITIVRGKGEMTKEQILGLNGQDMDFATIKEALIQATKQAVALVKLFKFVENLDVLADKVTELTDTRDFMVEDIAKRQEILRGIEKEYQKKKAELESTLSEHEKKVNDDLAELDKKYTSLKLRKDNLQVEITQETEAAWQDYQVRVEEAEKAAKANLDEIEKKAKDAETRLAKAEKDLATLKAKL